MSQTPPSNSERNGFATRSIHVPILLCVIAMGLVIAVHVDNRMRDLRPVYLPLQLSEGSTARATFIAGEAGGFDVEVEMQKTIRTERIRRLITPTDRPGELNLKWTIKSDGRPLAEGNCEDFLFISNELFRYRVLGQLLGMESYDAIGTTRYGRGVGHFVAAPGAVLDVAAVSGSNAADELSAANPRLVVRLNRRARVEILRRSVAVLILATILFAVGAAWGTVRCLAMRRARHQYRRELEKQVATLEPAGSSDK